MSINRKLPIGIQDFEDLRTNNYLYVDKTAFIYRLATTGKPYFLGRPRRFGKSLFLSTLKAYFLGKKELFDGLAIAGLEKEWVEYPVFYIDFNVGIYTDTQSLYQTLNSNLRRLEEKWGKVEGDDNLATRFEGLIRRAYEQTGNKVVVLVDEYDKPLLGIMDNLQVNDEIRKILKSFYGVLKSADTYLRFVFLTGVTKFSKVSIFSDLNQLQDISMREQYAGICGISEIELIKNFQPEITALAEKQELTYEETLAKLKKHYDGYHFSENSEDMYNPFSLLNTFEARKFRDYWYETGTPTFLVKMLKNMDFDVKKLENDLPFPVRSITDYQFGDENPVPILYQSGYLTIKAYNGRMDEYTLGYPNEEVKYGFMNNLLPVFMPKKDVLGEFSTGNFIRDLIAVNVDGFMTRLKAFFSDIPNELNNKEEKHYQTVFYLLFKLMGQFVQTEVSSAIGRADAVVAVDDTIFIFEFKLTGKETAEDALKQIDERKYAARYAVSDKKIVKVGVDFDAENRTLNRWVQG
ncbi:ATPase AAA [Bacteroidia bacterium]|nr:ATPase AAA [Bacteroidia bacterium]